MDRGHEWKVWNEEHQCYRMFKIDEETGCHVETTPICLFRCKKSVEGCKDTYRCTNNPKVVHCSGQAIGCRNYTAPGRQLELNLDIL